VAIAKCNVNRQSRILKHINADGPGIEIGPCHSPVATKRKGFNVEIIDHLDREGLIKKYSGQRINTDNIEEVDHVWHGQTYAELTGRHHYYDWVIASHVIEHTPDLVAFIRQCDEILNQTGVLSLVIPDKRYCFDKFRPITSLSHVIDRHLAGVDRHSPGSVAEYYLNVVRCEGEDAWDSRKAGSLAFSHPPDAGQINYSRAKEAGEWLDVHAWCFVPHAFRLLIQDLYDLGLIQLKELSFHPTVGCEFYMTLSREGEGMPLNRMSALQEMELEITGQSAGKPSNRLKKLIKKGLRVFS
jgi:hypothetical protein